jgi:hypothetical protein
MGAYIRYLLEMAPRSAEFMSLVRSRTG